GQDVLDFLPVVGHQDLLAGFEEHLDALPVVRDHTGRGPGRLKYPGRGGIAGSRHTLPADVHHGPWGGIEGVVVPGVYMAEMPYVLGKGQGLPTTAPQDES